MEDLCRKVPLICKNIINELDNQSFVNFRDASRKININLRNERFYWIRVLSIYGCLIGDFKDSWASVVKRTPPEFVKELVMVTKTFWKENLLEKIILTQSFIKPTFLAPHHIAAGCGHLEFYKHFVERTGDLNPKEENSEISTLHFAACNGKLEICQSIIDNSNVPSKNPENSDGNTPLHIATDSGYMNIYKLIIEYIQDKNLGNTDGDTPLHMAAGRGYLEICKVIIENV